MSIPLPPVVIQVGVQQVVQIADATKLYAIILSNKSQYDILIQGFGIQGQRWITSGLEMLLLSHNSNEGRLVITAYNNANITNPQAAIVLLTEYFVDEPIPIGTWPTSIPTQTVQATSSVTQANTLVNDGNAPGTLFIESTPSDAASSTVRVDNSGNVTIKGDNAGTLTTLLQILAGASPSVILGALTALVTVVNNLTVGGDVTATDYLLSGPALVANYAKIGSDPGGDINFDLPNGTRRLQINSTIPSIVASTGVRITADRFDLTGGGGQYNLNQGSLSRLSIFTGGGSGVFNHGLGAVPMFVVITTTAAGSSQTVGASNFTATQVTVTVGAALAWTGLAIRF